MNTYLMVRRDSDLMIVKIYVVPKELPQEVRFSQVIGKAYEKIHHEYSRQDYSLLIGDAYSPEDFLRSFPDWARGTTTSEVEEWNCAA